VEVGIGDDGAVIQDPSAECIVVVTDLLLDGVHFDLHQTSTRLAGRKAIAVNLSDLAAMACYPTAAFVSIALPRAMRSTAELFLQELYSGIEELTNQYRFTLAGGDTNSWTGPFVINVCLTGRPMSERPHLRSTARPGDALFVTGPLGGSLQHERHLTFTPRLDAAEWLVNHVPVHAMMDISDGLSIDLHRMMEASRAAAVLNSESIPIHADVPENGSPAQRLSAALSDGEDFELLFSVPPEAAKDLRKKAAAAGFEFFEIGSVAEGFQSHIRDRNGQLTPLKVTGWQHELP
jgi:thiamine-monophosphate kinase